ncbi:MAG: hypothetical protein IKJ32_06730 [Clostridia bacterium]|nr:hypothetical protein [Clostridia bacterium]
MKNFLRILMLVLIVAALVVVGIFLTKDGDSNVDVSGDVLSGEVSGEVVSGEVEEELVSGDEVAASGDEVAEVSGDVVEDTTSGDVAVSGETVDAE